MKKTILSLMAAFMLIGCGESGSNTVAIDNNATVPYDINTTITSVNNVSTITFGNGAIYVTCEANSTCDITLGNKDNSTVDNTNNAVDNSDSSVRTSSTTDNSVVTTGTTTGV